MNLSALDIIVAVGIVYSLYHGFTKGLIISLASLVGLILGVYGAIQFSGFTANYLNNHWEIQIPILSFALTFLLILLLIYFLGKLLEKVVNMMALGVFNKIGGAIFSALRMSLILTVLLIVVEKINEKFMLWDNALVTESYCYPSMKMIADQLLPLLRELLSSSSAIALL